MDAFLTGRRENVSHLAEHPRYTIIEADVIEGVGNSLGNRRIDGAFHLACPASPVDYLRHPLETLRVSAEGTRNVLECCRAQGARFLLASTSEVYGDPDVHPQVESYWGHVNPNGPRSVYDEGKRYAEAMACAYERLGYARVRIARIFNTYGPRMRLDDGRVLPAFGCAAIRGEPLPVFGDGTQTRSLCFVDDLVDGLVRLFSSEVIGPVNLGNPQELTMLDLATEIIEAASSKSSVVFEPLPQDDPRRRKPNIDRARTELGWEPRIDRKQGLKRTLEDFRQRLGTRLG
jgi:dTDP-glucose 4,6-dehydratase